MKASCNSFKWLTFASLLIGIVSLCLSIARCEPVKADWAAILVGILSLLVAALIGWQIYAIIDIKDIRNKVRADKLNNHIASERSIATMFIAISDYYYSVLAKEEQPEHEKIYKYIYNRVSAILYASRISDYETCRIIVKALFETICPENIETSEKNKRTLFDLLSDVNEPRKIQHFSELISWLSRIRVSR